MTDAIKKKLAALLAMTPERGATEDESETAMKLAAALAAKHGIDLASIEGGKKIKMERKRDRTEMRLHQAYAAQAAAELFGVACELYKEGKEGFVFIGRDENVAMAEETMFWLFRQIEELYKSALPKGLSQKERAEFRRTFKPACALRVRERAIKIVRDMVRSDAGARGTGHNALTVMGHFETLRREIRELRYGPEPTAEDKARWAKEAAEYCERDRLWREQNPEEAKKRDAEAAREDRRFARRKGPRERTMPIGSGTEAGYVAGDRVELNRKVQS